jgi:hypothetical protein
MKSLLWAYLAASSLSDTIPPCVSGLDPAQSWLVYGKAPGFGKKMTFLNVTWTVPSQPLNYTEEPPNQSSFWFGIEPVSANILIQPVLKLGDGAPGVFHIYNVVWNWLDFNWFESTKLKVSPGNTIVATVSYFSSQNAYSMYIGKAANNGTVSCRSRGRR